MEMFCMLTRRRLLLKDEPASSVNVGDSDDETPLFFCEDVPTAKILVEEYHANAAHKNVEGLTVRTVIL